MESAASLPRGKFPDSRVASAIFCAFVASIILVTLGVYSPIQKQTDVGHVLVWIVQVCSMLAGIITTCLVAWTAFQQSKGRANIEHKIHSGDPSMGLKLFFLWFFAFPMILQASLYLAIDLDCMFKGEGRVFPLTLSALSTIISMTFTILQVGFISYARETNFPQKSRAMFCLLIIVVANLAIWYNSFVRDKNNLFAIGNISMYLNESILRNETACFWTSPIQKVTMGLLPFLIPARLEFGLFASSFLFRLLPVSSKIENRHLPTQEHDGGFLVNLKNDTRLHRRNRARMRPEKTIAILLSIILNLPILILSFLIFIPQGNVLSPLFPAWISLRMLLTFVLIILHFIGLHHLHKENFVSSNEATISVIDCVLIFATTGFVGYLTIGFLSSLMCKCNMFGIVSTSNVLLIINGFLQTIFILQGRRCSKPQNQLKWARFICLVLSIANFHFWVEGSFSNIRKHDNFSLQDLLLGKDMWNLINQVLYPMVTFYHLICCIELYRMYKVLGT